MRLIVNHYHHPDEETAERLYRIDSMLGTILENQGILMSSFDDLAAAQSVTDAKVAAVKSDVEKLLGLLAAIPPAGMTPEQQAALDAAVVHAGAINDSLSAVDAEVNPPAA